MGIRVGASFRSQLGCGLTRMPTVLPFRRRGRSIAKPVLLLCAYGVLGSVAVGFFLAPSRTMPTVHRLAAPSQESVVRLSVIDGDTIRDLSTGRTVRLVGFNAPETREAQCAEEADLGERAKARLQELIRSGWTIATSAGLSTTAYIAAACRWRGCWFDANRRGPGGGLHLWRHEVSADAAALVLKRPIRSDRLSGEPSRSRERRWKAHATEEAQSSGGLSWRSRPAAFWETAGRPFAVRGNCGLPQTLL